MEGLTVAEFDADMKICDLKEFQSKAGQYMNIKKVV